MKILIFFSKLIILTCISILIYHVEYTQILNFSLIYNFENIFLYFVHNVLLFTSIEDDFAVNLIHRVTKSTNNLVYAAKGPLEIHNIIFNQKRSKILH